MFWIGVGALFVAILMFWVAVTDDSGIASERHGPFAVGCVIAFFACVFFRAAQMDDAASGYQDGFAAGAIAHAAGKVTATRIDNGVGVDWKIEAVPTEPGQPSDDERKQAAERLSRAIKGLK